MDTLLPLRPSATRRVQGIDHLVPPSQERLYAAGRGVVRGPFEVLVEHVLKKTASCGSARAKSVMDDCSFWASTGPRTSTGSVAWSPVSARAHATSRGPRTGCAR